MRRLLITAVGLLLVVMTILGLSWLIYMPTSAERGVWRAQSGNMVLSIGAMRAKAYGQSSHSCGLLYEFPAHLKLVELMEGATIAMQGDSLVLTLDGSLEPQLFDRLDTLPAACKTPMTPTPRNVFDAMWTAMDEHYAFFDLYGVDWDARADLAPPPDAQMSDPDLLDLLGRALSGLDDGHIQIGTPFAYFSPRQRPDWLPEGSKLDRNALRSVARANAGVELAQLPDTSIEFGVRPDGIAYVMIRDMDVAQGFGQSSRDAAAQHFAVLREKLDQATGIILDLRQNPGGSDGVSFGFASHFIAQNRAVFTKTTRIGSGQSTPFTAILTAYDNSPLEAPIVLLTSDMTASAAEILTLALRDLPQVTVMGEATGGGLSDILGFSLPNGWAFGLSNQTYLTMAGELFEGRGIPPDVTLSFDAADFDAGRDPILAAAIKQLSKP